MDRQGNGRAASSIPESAARNEATANHPMNAVATSEFLIRFDVLQGGEWDGAGYFFLPMAAFLSATAWLFFWAAEEAAAFFCEDFFWLSFGDRSPME